MYGEPSEYPLPQTAARVQEFLLVHTDALFFALCAWNKAGDVKHKEILVNSGLLDALGISFEWK